MSARKRIVVAMSGGVDSSVAAALVARAGHDAIGVTLQLYSAAQSARKGACCAGQDIQDAKRVAASLGIPHYVLDYEARFRKAVIEDFADTYARGETPVPCVKCNEKVKFADLLDTARELGAEALATGHYVRRIDGPGGAELHAAAEASRDQSYFLFATTRLFALPGGRDAQERGARHCRRAWPRHRRQAGQPGYLFRPGGALHQCDRSPASRCSPSRRYRRSGRRRAGPP
jgi:hypothetical protein